MNVQPFAIKSIPAGDTYWVVVPTQDMDSVQLSLDIGGGEGPVIATVEWIRSATMSEGGFLFWSVNGESLTSAPSWLPHPVETAIREMALAMLTLRHKQPEA